MQNFVLLTALPPTKGHKNLVNFANLLPGETRVILCTQPEEPLVNVRRGIVFNWAERMDWLSYTLPQSEEEFPHFREMWRDIMLRFGFMPGDRIVASEHYGAWLAKMLNGEFIPYDLDRAIEPVRATDVRYDIYANWDDVVPEVQQYFQRRFTIFGAESVGKTTTAKALGEDDWFQWRPEWARTYLESRSPILTTEVMTRIWEGQFAQQALKSDARAIIQDTDLFSTIGYWRLHEDEYGPIPGRLVGDAKLFQSDRYYILDTNIPFEEDALRYGGKVRESPTKFWVDLCREFQLPYTVVADQNRTEFVRQDILSRLEYDPEAYTLAEYERR